MLFVAHRLGVIVIPNADQEDDIITIPSLTFLLISQPARDIFRSPL
jgi:hypothetical protein